MTVVCYDSSNQSEFLYLLEYSIMTTTTGFSGKLESPSPSRGKYLGNAPYTMRSKMHVVVGTLLVLFDIQKLKYIISCLSLVVVVSHGVSYASITQRLFAGRCSLLSPKFDAPQDINGPRQ
jgi:hypothetical protein